MNNKALYRFITLAIALVWFINGFFCKVLNLVPRHRDIVATILGTEHSQIITIGIGILEIIMSIWILSRYQSRLNALTQMVVVICMNILEFIYAPQWLLWGKLNLVFALLFVGLVYYHTFILQKQIYHKAN